MTSRGGVVPAGMQHSGQVLSVLVSLKDTAESFTRELQQNLAGVDAAELQQIADAVYVPFESQVSRWDTCSVSHIFVYSFSSG